MWNFNNGTFDQIPLTDAYRDYCFHEYQDLTRHYKLLQDKTRWGFATFCLQSFLNSGGRMVQHRISPIEKAYLRDAIAYLQTGADSLWKDYEDNPEFQKELGMSYLWVRGLKEVYRKPPVNHYELYLAFGAIECFMLLEEKKLL